MTSYETEERLAIQEEGFYCGDCNKDTRKLDYYTAMHNSQCYCGTITDIGSCAYKAYQKIYEEE